MSQGLEIFRANGTLSFSSSDRLARVLAMEDWFTSTIPAETWTQVVPTGFAGDAWGILLPMFPIDVSTYYPAPIGSVRIDALNFPGKIYVDMPKSTTYPAMLIYGVY